MFTSQHQFYTCRILIGKSVKAKLKLNETEFAFITGLSVNVTLQNIWFLFSGLL